MKSYNYEENSSTNSDSEFGLLKQHIIQRLGKNPDKLDFVLSYFRLIHHNKRETILEFNNICNNVYFVCNGGIQVLYHDSKGNIWTRDIILQEQWCCSMESFIHQKPSFEEFKCIENTTLLAINKNSFDTLCMEVPNFGLVFQQILTELYIETTNRIKNVLSQNAKERIKWLYKNKPELVLKVSSLVLSSYLHINKDVFSRLRPEVLNDLKI